MAHEAVSVPVPRVKILQRKSVDKKRRMALPANSQGIIEAKLKGGIINIIIQSKLALASTATKIKLTSASVAVIAFGLAN